MVRIKPSVYIWLVERAIYSYLLSSGNTKCISMVFWNQISDGVVSATVDDAFYWFLTFLCYVPIIDLVPSRWKPVYFKNNNLHNFGFNNCRSSNIRKIKTHINFLFPRVSNKRHLWEILKTPRSNGRFLFLRL